MGSADQGIADRGTAIGLRALRTLASSNALDRAGIRKHVEKALFRASRDGFRSAAAVSRSFKAAQRLTGPSRQSPVKSAGLFDITPDDEQQMLIEAAKAFAAERIRPAAQAADEECATPSQLLRQANELGVNMLGVPQELGGVMQEQAAVSGVLIALQLAHGDLGIAYSILAPGAVATAIGRFGDAQQQAAYLPPFTSEDVPAAALAMLEPRPLFDPLRLQTKATRDGGDWVISGVKSLIARAKDCELFVVAAEAEGVGADGVARSGADGASADGARGSQGGPALFIVESSTKGLSIQPEPSMGLRPAATGRLILQDVRVPEGALLSDGDIHVYRECVHRSQIAFSALAVGACEAVLHYLIPYVNDRIAFGEPISNRQAVAFSVADIGIETEAIRLLTLRAAARADQGASFAREAALAKRLSSEKAMLIGSQGVQLLGGHGYVKEHPVERWYRDLRAIGVIQGALIV